MAKTSYVCGFAFEKIYTNSTPDFTDCRFLLIKKKRGPAQMAGKLNGIGGKIELGEAHRGAMVREFREETGVATGLNEWILFHKARYSAQHSGMKTQAEVYFMCCVLEPVRFRDAVTATDETVMTLSASQLQTRKRMRNLDYLVPMAFTHLFYPETRTLEG